MLAAIQKEIVLQKNYLSNKPIETIYFGGGTPSLLSADALQTLLDTIYTQFEMGKNPEISLEANPDDLSKTQVNELRKTDINRFSIGIQSFFDEDLKYMNRAHSAHDAENSIKRVQDAGFENITLDLIYGYPILSNEKWNKNIQLAIELSVEHISAYALTVEPKTALAAMIRDNKTKNIDDEQASNQFLFLMDKLNENGFEHYEVSNFAKNKNYSKHNTNYWKQEWYLGIGPSAHSFNGVSRKWNVANNVKYLDGLSNNKIPSTEENLSPAMIINEYLMTSLRTMWGLSLDKVSAMSNQSLKNKLLESAQKFISRELLIIENGHLLLTQSGKLYADGIASDLFISDEEI